MGQVLFSINSWGFTVCCDFKLVFLLKLSSNIFYPMSLPRCQNHSLTENVICCEDDCLGLYCQQCFKDHHPDHAYGVLLSLDTQETLIRWTEFLILRMGQIRANIKMVGYNSFFEMKLNPNYPKGLVNNISTPEITDIIISKLEECQQMLEGNVQFINTCKTLASLNNPGLLKDIFIFFLFDTNRNIGYILENIQKGLKQNFPDKNIYDFVYFTFNPKELRQLELKRKQLVKNVEKDVLVKLRNPNIAYSPNLMRSKNPQPVLPVRRPVREVASPYRHRSPRNNHIERSPEQFEIPNSPNQTRKTQESSYRQQENTVSFNSLVDEILPGGRKTPGGRANRGPRQEDQSKSMNIRNNEILKQPSLGIHSQIRKFKQQLREKVIEELNQSGLATQRQNKQKQTLEKMKEKHTALTSENKETEDEPIQLKSQINLVEESSLTDVYSSQKIYTRDQSQNPQKIIEYLKTELAQKQKSIGQLERLRVNQVQMLKGQIEKLIFIKEENKQLRLSVKSLSENVQQKDKSIQQLNALINNEEEELNYRENQVELLSGEIKKLMKTTERANMLESQLRNNQSQLEDKDSLIKRLCSAIDMGGFFSVPCNDKNIYQNLQILIHEKKEAEKDLEQLEKRETCFSDNIRRIQAENYQLKTNSTHTTTYSDNTINYDDELMVEVIELQAQVVAKHQDLIILVDLINNTQAYLPQNLKAFCRQKLGLLKTLPMEQH